MSIYMYLKQLIVCLLNISIKKIYNFNLVKIYNFN